MGILQATEKDAEIISVIVSESNKDVANAFGITIDNNPKHPSFYNAERVLSDFERGEEYFIYKAGDMAIACVAFESPRPGVAYLNRLSVLPPYRKKGIGETLVKHVVSYSESKGIQRVSIGIIAEHLKLKNWYLKLGFIGREVKSFPHLPFDVLYMSFEF